MGSYDEMLVRLEKYRKSIPIKQKQMGQAIGVSQEQYSYLENGNTKLTDKNLKALADTGADIDYIITGEHFQYSADELEDEINRAGKERDFALKMVANVMSEKIERGELQNVSRSEAKLIEAMADSWDDFSMVNFVREEERCSQIEMAQRLGVGIKKYRELEKETLYPDAELLLSLYNMSGYQPALFMNLCDRRMLAVKMLWSAFEAGDKSQLLDFVRNLRNIMQGNTDEQKNNDYRG